MGQLLFKEKDKGIIFWISKPIGKSGIEKVYLLPLQNRNALRFSKTAPLFLMRQSLLFVKAHSVSHSHLEMN